MTRLDLLKILVGQARENGFEFRRWFTTRLTLEWDGAEAAFQHLGLHRHYYALLFSHEFAQAFWKAGQPITFQVPARSFERVKPDGTTAIVQRKPFLRRTTRPDAWRYHLRQMALADEPLRYMRRYLRVEDAIDDLVPDSDTPASETEARAIATPLAKPVPATLLLARKAHERRQLAKELKPITIPSKRGARVPGTRPKST